MRIFYLIYSVYGLFMFGLIFLVLLPFFLIAIFIPSLEKMAPTLNWIWARAFFFMLFLNRTRIEYETPLSSKQRYIFCANHFSYLDIPTMGLIRDNFKFMGKSSLRTIPLWGFMYSKLHILVNRESLKDRYASWEKAKQEIRRGFSIVFFPEGGIMTTKAPQMVRFKEGSFRLAVDEQIPLVPVTIHHNHILLPDEKPFVLRPGRVSLKVHHPIFPESSDDAAVKKLKEQVRTVIEQEIERTNP